MIGVILSSVALVLSLLISASALDAGDAGKLVLFSVLSVVNLISLIFSAASLSR